MTYEPSAVLSMLRARAREKLAELEPSVVAQHVMVDFDQRIELTTWLAEGRRLLHGDVPPEARPADPKVRPLRLMVGPAFKKRSLFTSADCLASAEGLPPDGPGGAA